MERRVELLGRLGNALVDFGRDGQSQQAIADACAANDWFTEDEIVLSVQSLRTSMLVRRKLRAWLSRYDVPVKNPKNIGVILAGNIPLVGLFDIICAVASGHNTLVKPSSKDCVLIHYMMSLLLRLEPELKLGLLNDEPLNGVIATGSNNTGRYFKTIYRDIPCLIRGSRASVAVLTGDETDEQLTKLSRDVFMYNGLGCRNISMLFVPAKYDFDRLLKVFAPNVPANSKYRNNYLSNRATHIINGDSFIDGDGFTLFETDRFPDAISELSTQYYSDIESVRSWLRANDGSLQCVAASNLAHPRRVDFGMSQYPALTDYPDGADVISFLQNI